MKKKNSQLVLGLGLLAVIAIAICLSKEINTPSGQSVAGAGMAGSESPKLETQETQKVVEVQYHAEPTIK